MYIIYYTINESQTILKNRTYSWNFELPGKARNIGQNSNIFVKNTKYVIACQNVLLRLFLCMHVTVMLLPIFAESC